VIWGSNGGEYEDYCFLAFDAVLSGRRRCFVGIYFDVMIQDFLPGRGIMESGLKYQHSEGPPSPVFRVGDGASRFLPKLVNLYRGVTVIM
jgi:hypothetical protein